MSNYYVKSKTRGRSSGIKGTPQQALNYLTDDHDSKRIASASKAEIDYITRINQGYKADLEGGRLPLEGHGRCSGLSEKEMKDIFLHSCIPRHRDSLGRKTTATEGYKSHTLTLPKELSLLAESNPQAAYKAMNKGISEALEKAYEGKEYAAVSSIHRRNNEAEIHYHAHVLVAKFVKDKKTGKTHSLNKVPMMGGLGYEMKQLKSGWEETVTRELAKELHVQIKQEKNGKIQLTLPDGSQLEPINRASRRRIELAIAPQITYIDKHGNERTKAFRLNKMDAKIYEIASRNKGRNGWNRDEFLRTFPKDSIRIDRFDKRVETLKSVGYLSATGRLTKEFTDHAKVKWGEAPELQQLRIEMENERKKSHVQGIPYLNQNDPSKRGRIQALGKSEIEVIQIQRNWLESMPKTTPEHRELIEAEKALERFDKTSDQRIWSVSIEDRFQEQDAVERDRAELQSRIEALRIKADLSLIHPSNRSDYWGSRILQKAIDEDTRYIQTVQLRIKDLEEKRDTELAKASDDKSAMRIEKAYEEKLKPLRATEEILTNQLQEHRHWLDRYQNRRNEPVQHLKPEPKRKKSPDHPETEKHKSRQPAMTVKAFRVMLTNRGIGLLTKTALGPGLGAAMAATCIANCLREREVRKSLPPERIANLKRGIEAIVSTGQPEALQLSRWIGREDRLMTKMALGSLSPRAAEAARTAEQFGSMINRSESLARNSTLQIPEWLEQSREKIALIDARGQAMGLEPLTRQGLEAFSHRGLQSAINDDPALKKMSEAGSQWVQIPMNMAKMALGKLRVIDFGLSLGR